MSVTFAPRISVQDMGRGQTPAQRLAMGARMRRVASDGRDDAQGGADWADAGAPLHLTVGKPWFDVGAARGGACNRVGR